MFDGGRQLVVMLPPSRRRPRVRIWDTAAENDIPPAPPTDRENEFQRGRWASSV